MTNGCLNTALLLQRLQLLHPLFVLGTKHSVVTYVPVCFYKVSISGLLCTNMLLHIERKSVFQYRMFITQRIFLTLTYFGKIDCFGFLLHLPSMASTAASVVLSVCLRLLLPRIKHTLMSKTGKLRF